MFKALHHAYLNSREDFYPHDYVNLTRIHEGAIRFPKRTTFLSDEEKGTLEQDLLLRFDDACFITLIDGVYAFIGLVDLKSQVKKHEFVLPDVITGMVLNYQHYNTEAAPVTLLSKETLDYQNLTKTLTAHHIHTYGDDKVYVYLGKEKDVILSLVNEIDNLYLADGHHRFLASQHMKHKDSCLAMLCNVKDARIESITRSMKPQEPFEVSLAYLRNEGFKELDTELKKGLVAIEYQGKTYCFELQSMPQDIFGDHDIYRLHSQIISQGFKQYDSSQLHYSSQGVQSEDWIRFKTVAMDMDEFLDYADSGVILPPKSTALFPKCPSMLVMNVFTLE